MDRMFPPPANNQPPRDPHGPHGPFGPYGPHGPHFPEPWHNHYGRYPYPYLHAPHGLHPFFGERPWDHIHCAPECDDQLPIFSTVGRGLRGDSYRVKVAYDAEGETYLEGGYYDANTNTYHTDWTSENINGGHLMYQYNLRTNTNPQTFTITFRYVRPERSESEWVWTTPAIPYIWDADNDGIGDTDNIVGAGVATLFLKKTTDSNWVTPSDANTPHTVAQAKNVQEKLLYPSGWTRSMFNSPAATKPWTVNLEYGVGGDIDVPTVEDLAKIIGVTPDYLRELVNERAIPVNIDFGHDGNGHPYNVKEYIDFHLHNDLFGNHSPSSLPDELGELKHDGSNTQPGYKNYGVWDWILWLKDYVDDNMLDISHLHNDLFGNHSPNSLPDELGELKHDGSNTQSGYQNYGVWDWILYAIDQLKDHLHKDLLGTAYNNPTIIPAELRPPLLRDGGTKGVWDWIKETIKTVLGIGKTGAWPGNLAGFGGTKTVWDWINGISDPQMHTFDYETDYEDGVLHPVDLVFFELPPLSEGASAISSSYIAQRPKGRLKTKLLISYFDVLPETVVTITPTDKTESVMITPSCVGVVCARGTNNPINLKLIQLPEKIGKMKPPVFSAETLSNCGWLVSQVPGTQNPVNNGNMQIYTGVGTVVANDQNSSNIFMGWPWAASDTNGNFYAYMINRFTDAENLATDRWVLVDYARDYHTSYIQATIAQ